MDKNARSPQRRPSMLWLAAIAGIATLIAVVIVLLRLHGGPPEPPPPAWRSGNLYFQKLASHDWKGAVELCRDPRSAQASRSVLEPLIQQDGPLQVWGSVGDPADLPPSVRQTSQAYQVTFGGHAVPVRILFVRDGGNSNAWKISTVQIPP